MISALDRKRSLIRSRLSPRGRIVLNALIAPAGNVCIACPSLYHLERLTGIRRRTLQRTLLWLCNSGHLQIVPRFGPDGAQLTNRFEINHQRLLHELGDSHD